MMGYNLRKAGKPKIVVPLTLSALCIHLLLWQFVNHLLHSNRQWSLNKAVGWDWDITNFLKFQNLIFEYFIFNFILGLALAFPFWNKYLSQYPTYENKKPWIPLLLTCILYGGTLALVSLRR